MRSPITVLALLFVLCPVAAAQLLTQTASAGTGGGGASAGTSLTMYSAVMPGITSSSGTGGSLRMPAGLGALSGILTGIAATGSIHVEEGWNIVSTPVLPPDPQVSSLFPTAVSKAFSYANGYQVTSALTVGMGYWMKFSGEWSTEVPGLGVSRETLSVSPQWNLVGGLSYPVPVSEVNALPPASITSPFYSYSNGGGYATADTLKAGRGYWVKIQNGGHLVLRPGFLIEPAAPPPAAASPSNAGPPQESRYGILQIKDATGKTQTLRFTTGLTAEQLDALDLPPVPPPGRMDARYGTNRQVESASGETSRTIPVLLSSAVYPVSLIWSNEGGPDAYIRVGGSETAMTGEGSAVLEKPDMALSVRLAPASPDALPGEFALDQNYPNPFNPATIIRYALPSAGHVELRLYDLLGREVRTLIDENLEAGYRSVRFDATGLSSGVYVYRLTAGGGVFTRKLMVLK